jgi:biopolymer transport protein TolR
MGMAVGGSKDGPVSEPNIVPLIDVLLVLIIIFMVITPRTPTGLQTIVPQPPPPNIVPLIDVLLVLIIIFMVITPRTPTGLSTIVPQPPPPNQKQTEPDNRTIVVQVMNGNKLKINQDDSNWNDLGNRLEDIFKERADKIAFVKGDDSVEFAQVARAIDIMRGAGIDHVGLITAKIEAGQ